MKAIPYETQLVLARCDLERVVRQYLDAGVEPRRLAEELLDVCARLHDVSRVAADYGSQGDGSSKDARVATAGDSSVRVPRGAHSPAKFRWLRKIDEIRHGLGGRPCADSQSDPRRSRADD